MGPKYHRDDQFGGRNCLIYLFAQGASEDVVNNQGLDCTCSVSH